MTLDQLIKRCREQSQDLAAGQLWSREEWVDALNEAVDEVAIRSNLLENVRIDLQAVAGDPLVELPAEVFRVQSLAFASKPLRLCARADLEATEPDGWFDLSGTPEAAFYTDGCLRLYRTPVAAAKVVAFCSCTPDTKMIAGADEAPFDPRQHRYLCNWALRCAYLKSDPDAGDLSKASAHEALFERVFGQRPSETAMSRLKVRRHRRASTPFV